MSATIKVWPTKATAVDLKHPHGPALVLAGADWPDDSFTARRLRDGAATLEKGKVYVPPKDADGAPAGTAPAEPAKA